MPSLEDEQELVGNGQDILSTGQNCGYYLIAVFIKLYKQLSLSQGKSECESMAEYGAEKTERVLKALN